MRLEPDDLIPGPDPQGPVSWWLLLAIIGVLLGTASVIGALAGPGTELAGTHHALLKVCIL